MARRFAPAVRQNAFVRALVYGVPGSGKSRGCLQLAEALAEGQPLALIDAEPEAPAHYYADLVAFDRAGVIKPTTDEYLALLNEAAREGYAVLVVDGLTQHWEVMQEWHDQLAQQPKANAFAAWGPIGEDCERLLRQLLNYPGHVLVTAQAKQLDEAGELIGAARSAVLRARDAAKTALNGQLSHGANQAAERTRQDEPTVRRLAGLFGAVTQADDLDQAAERFDVAKTAWTQASEEGLRQHGSAGATLADLEATARRHLERLRNGEGVPA